VPGAWSTGPERSGGRIRRESPARSTGRELRSGDGKTLKTQQGSAAFGVFDQTSGSKRMWRQGRARRLEDSRQE
jgi:hypothetical protein